jgi:hypothetical protein
MKMLALDDAVAAARKMGADEHAVKRLKAWRRRGATDGEIEAYRAYQRKWQMGRVRIELAISHGMSPGTLRQRMSRGMTLNDALRTPVVARRGMGTLVEVRRGVDGRWA